MAEQKTSILRIIGAVAGVLVMLGLFGTCRHNNKMDRINDDLADDLMRTLPERLFVETLPLSVHGLQCKGLNRFCPGAGKMYVAQCVFAFDPEDLEAVFDHEMFRQDLASGRYYEKFDTRLGPDFDISTVYRWSDDTETNGVSLYTGIEQGHMVAHFDLRLELDECER